MKSSKISPRNLPKLAMQFVYRDARQKKLIDKLGESSHDYVTKHMYGGKNACYTIEK